MWAAGIQSLHRTTGGQERCESGKGKGSEWRGTIFVFLVTRTHGGGWREGNGWKTERPYMKDRVKDNKRHRGSLMSQYSGSLHVL